MTNVVCTYAWLAADCQNTDVGKYVDCPNPGAINMLIAKNAYF